MKINQATNWYQLNQVAANQASKEIKSETSKSKDHVEVSGNSKEFQRYIEQAKTQTENRQAKIETIKAQIANGEYEVNSELVAKAMMDWLF